MYCFPETVVAVGKRTRARAQQSHTRKTIGGDPLMRVEKANEKPKGANDPEFLCSADEKNPRCCTSTERAYIYIFHTPYVTTKFVI